jgi:hypothetical protein
VFVGYLSSSGHRNLSRDYREVTLNLVVITRDGSYSA